MSYQSSDDLTSAQVRLRGSGPHGPIGLVRHVEPISFVSFAQVLALAVLLAVLIRTAPKPGG
jgi:hypothetical protein